MDSACFENTLGSCKGHVRHWTKKKSIYVITCICVVCLLQYYAFDTWTIADWKLWTSHTTIYRWAKRSSHFFINQIVSKSKPSWIFDGRLSIWSSFLRTSNENPKERFMTAHWEGRLGNRLFIYASLYGIAKTNGFVAFISTEYDLTEFFNLSLPVFTSYDPSNFTVFAVNETGIYNEAVNNLSTIVRSKHVQLSGYFQSWKYFNMYSDQIRQEFSIQQDILDNRMDFLSRMARLKFSITPNNSIVYVGVHVRLGDMAADSSRNGGFTSAPWTYLESAVNYYKVQFSHIMFVVCSDDIRQTRRLFSKIRTNLATEHHQIVFSEGTSVLMDMALLSLCNHTIITVGTFGWWAGWLAGGQVVYYKNYPRPNSTFAAGFSAKDYFPNEWIGLE